MAHTFQTRRMKRCSPATPHDAQRVRSHRVLWWCVRMRRSSSGWGNTYDDEEPPP